MKALRCGSNSQTITSVPSTSERKRRSLVESASAMRRRATALPSEAAALRAACTRAGVIVPTFEP